MRNTSRVLLAMVFSSSLLVAGCGPKSGGSSGDGSGGTTDSSSSTGEVSTSSTSGQGQTSTAGTSAVATSQAGTSHAGSTSSGGVSQATSTPAPSSGSSGLAATSAAGSGSSAVATSSASSMVLSSSAGATSSQSMATLSSSAAATSSASAVSSSSSGAASEHVVIQELCYDSAGTDTAAGNTLFLVLAGPPGLALTGWSLHAVDGATGNTYRTISLDTSVVAADGLLMFASSNGAASLVSVADGTLAASTLDMQNGPDSLILLNGPTVVDALGYGTFTAALLPNNRGEGMPAGTTLPGGCLSRDAAFTDTNDNHADFIVVASPATGGRTGGSTSSSGAASSSGHGSSGGVVSSSSSGNTNPCDGVTCALPPANACANTNTLTVFETVGTCSAGQCAYASRQEPCTFGCVNGACAGNPCQGVTCSQPPSNACVDATTLQVFTSSGTCNLGECSYASSLLTCQYGCAGNACTNDPCAGRTCGQPPASYCVDVSTLRAFGTGGVCSGGNCLYSPTDTTCQFGCNAGACNQDPCAGKTCGQPPAAYCMDANTLRSFGTGGVCTGGNCLYSPTDTTCQYGCSNGACMGNPCQGVTCATPPANTCLDLQTLKTWQSPGTCAGGACGYTAQFITCQYGCNNGACANDPCQGVSCSTPPANNCADSLTLRTFAAAGTCAGGGCSYAPSLVTCTYGCTNGACNNDPCQGVTCNSPPARACLDTTHLRTFSAPGSCSGGGCTYAAVDSTCQFGCSNGACNNDPCQGVTCGNPPAQTCVGSSVRTYNTAGTCSSGGCTYGYTDTACATGCANGMCKAPTCGGTTCDTPPAASCTSANHLSTYYPVGICSGGTTCTYTHQEVDCSQGCLNGACIGGSWTLEAAPFTNPFTTVAVTYDAAGQPVMGGCDSNGKVLMRRRTASGWVEESVDTGMGYYCQAAVALDASGEPMMAWYDSVNGDLRFALRNAGAWTPKELVANADNVGGGVSIAALPDGRPAVAYNHSTTTVSDVKYATRSASGLWSEEVVMAGGAGKTDVKIIAGVPWVTVNPSAVAVRGTTGGWMVTTLEGGGSFNAAVPFPGSLVVEGGVPSLVVTVTNPLRGSTANTMFRTLGAAWSEVALNETPLVYRSESPQAFLVQRGTTSPYTGVIRVRRGDVWSDVVSAVPYYTSLIVPVGYTGQGGQHILYDKYSKRLASPSTCTPQCTGRSCGEDGCGGTCGSCTTGTCSPAGTCSAFRETTLPGFTPNAAIVGAGQSTLHLAQSSYSSYSPLKYRSSSGTGWTLPSDIASTATVLRNSEIPMGTNDEPLVCSNDATNNMVVNELLNGSWTTPPAPTVQGTYFRTDAAGTWYLVRTTTTQIYLRTGSGGTWGAETLIYTKPSSYDSVSVYDVAVSPLGKVTLYLVGAYWVSGSNPGYQYAWGLWSNETGTWAATNLGWPVNTTYVTGRLRYDASERLHLACQRGYFTKPAGGAVTSESWPAGFNWGVLMQLATDRAGNFAMAYQRTTAGVPEVAIARRTGPGTWSVEAAPLMGGQPQGTVPSTNFMGLMFDAADTPHVILDDALTFREIRK